jgi:hypothetical protein
MWTGRRSQDRLIIGRRACEERQAVVGTHRRPDPMTRCRWPALFTRAEFEPPSRNVRPQLDFRLPPFAVRLIVVDADPGPQKQIPDRLRRIVHCEEREIVATVLAAIAGLKTEIVTLGTLHGSGKVASGKWKSKCSK